MKVRKSLLVAFAALSLMAVAAGASPGLSAWIPPEMLIGL